MNLGAISTVAQIKHSEYNESEDYHLHIRNNLALDKLINSWNREEGIMDSEAV